MTGIRRVSTCAATAVLTAVLELLAGVSLAVALTLGRLRRAAAAR